MNKEQIEQAANSIANLIVNDQKIHTMIAKASCIAIGLDPEVDHSELFEKDPELESRYYRAGAPLWSAVTIRAAVILDGLTNPSSTN